MNFGLKIIVNFEVIKYHERNFLGIIIQYIQNLYYSESRIREI